jgi:NADPH-dependent 2,4-dienoyl-CoA reductase/sulfur reductase-like enzyme
MARYGRERKVLSYTRVLIIIIQHKILEIVCTPEVPFYGLFDTRIGFEDPELVYKRLFGDVSVIKLLGGQVFLLDGREVCVCVCVCVYLRYRH